MSKDKTEDNKEIAYTIFWAAAFLVSLGVGKFKNAMSPTRQAADDADASVEELKQRF